MLTASKPATKTLLAGIFVGTIMLCGCDNNSDGDVIVETFPQLIEKVTGVTLNVLDGTPMQLQITANGLAASASWTQPQLNAREYTTPPADGIYDFDFRAIPPEQPQAAAPTPITVDHTIDLPDGLLGIRIHTVENNRTAMLPGKPIDSTPSRRIMLINNISLTLADNPTRQLTIIADGVVSTSGWTEPRLVPYEYLAAPADGVYDFDFVALRPSGAAMTVLTDIQAQHTLSPVPDNLTGVRIHSDTNSIRAPLPDPTQPAAYFEFRGTDETDRFVILLTNQAAIDHARALLAGNTDQQPSIMGKIIKERITYNPNWSYFLDPTTIEFFDLAIEVCDGNMRYIEEHLNEVGGTLLPDNQWCPWGSQLTRELTAN